MSIKGREGIGSVQNCFPFESMALFGIQCSYVTEECLKEWKTTNTARKLKGAVSAARFVFELCQTLVSYLSRWNCYCFCLETFQDNSVCSIAHWSFRIKKNLFELQLTICAVENLISMSFYC